jgi:hypothetical protein
MIKVNIDFKSEEFRQVLREELANAIGDVMKQRQLPQMLTKANDGSSSH